MKRFLLSAGLISLIPIAYSNEIIHNFSIGGGVGWHNSDFNYKVTESDPTASTNRKFDLGKSSGAGDLAIGYAVKFYKVMLGVDVDYLFTSIKRRGDPNSLSDGSLSHHSHVKSNGAFGAVFKLGFHVREDLIGYVGVGIERRKFKVQYLIQDQPENSISKNYHQTVPAMRLGFDYALHKNATVGAEYRKAFYNSKNFTNNITTLRFKPETSDTVLLNVRFKLDFLQRKIFS